MTPNVVSITSIVFASLASASVYLSTVILGTLSIALLLTGALCIQLRLLCNLIDGLIAVENHKATIYGDLFNELPDRVSDTVIFLTIGFALSNPSLGWATAFFALLTAYARSYAGTIVSNQDFCGPMAKQHRMFTITGALIACCFLPVADRASLLRFILIFICTMCGVTTTRRISRLCSALRQKSK